MVLDQFHPTESESPMGKKPPQVYLHVFYCSCLQCKEKPDNRFPPPPKRWSWFLPMLDVSTTCTGKCYDPVRADKLRGLKLLTTMKTRFLIIYILADRNLFYSHVREALSGWAGMLFLYSLSSEFTDVAVKCRKTTYRAVHSSYFVPRKRTL